MPLMPVDMGFKQNLCPSEALSITAFSEAGFQAGIPRTLFLARLCLELSLEGQARVTWCPSPAVSPAQGSSPLGSIAACQVPWHSRSQLR